MYDPAHAPATSAACRGYKQALQGAKLLPNEADQASHAGADLRCKVLESELKRLEQQLSRSQESLRLRNEEIQHFQRELALSRHIVEDLQSTLGHQKELIKVYQQLVAKTGQIKNLAAQVEPSQQPAAASKRARPDLPMDQMASDSQATLKRLPEDVSPNDTINPPKRPRYHSASHPSAGNRATMRGSDHYDPPYAAKRQDVDRYVPNNWSAERYTPSAPKALNTSTGATASLDLAQRTIEVPPAPLKPSGVAPHSAGGCHPSRLKGTALDAFLRAQQLGIPYDPHNHVGIPTRCTACTEVLPSKSKLYAHKCVSHGAIPRRCTICQKMLPSGSKLDRHMQVSHGGNRRGLLGP